MKRRTALAIARAEKRARYKGGHQVKSKYGLKRHNLFATIPFPYTEEHCPGHMASSKPQICVRCGAYDESLPAPINYNDPEF